jgi:hypothetical protein
MWKQQYQAKLERAASPHLIRVFYAQDQCAIHFAGKQEIEQGSSKSAQVQVSGGRRGKPSSYKARGISFGCNMTNSNVMKLKGQL